MELPADAEAHPCRQAVASLSWLLGIEVATRGDFGIFEGASLTAVILSVVHIFIAIFVDLQGGCCSNVDGSDHLVSSS